MTFETPTGERKLCERFAFVIADDQRAMLESLLGIRRAGADFIVTYFAKDAARSLA